MRIVRLPTDGEPLRTYRGEPIQPHSVDGIEATAYYCADCGQEVEADEDDGNWYHKDERYNP